jgi:hypothetical protein
MVVYWQSVETTGLPYVKSRVLSFFLTLGVAAVAAVLVLQVLRTGGLPNPIAHGDFGGRVLDIAVLVFREGSNASSCWRPSRPAWWARSGRTSSPSRPERSPPSGATIATWFIAVGIIESLADNVSALNLQAAPASSRSSSCSS